MFATTNKLFLEYLHRVIDGNAISTAINNKRRDLAIELSELITELDFIIERVCELERKITDFFPTSEATISSKSNEERYARIELQILTKSFYYCAIARNKKFPLPGLRSFECTGVRDVRNMLLEHPEGSDSQVFIVSFGYGGSCGPVIKPIRRVGQENVFPDAGLFQNATEFRENLDHLLSQALASC